jgi:hypothetical protein
MTYDETWYICEFTEDLREEPDWTKVPEERREMVRSRWDAYEPPMELWKLWGPQIPSYKRLKNVVVKVLGPA